MRKINDEFVRELKEGCLSFFLEQVKNRKQELCLEIRNGYINIYYKGGNLLRITQKKNRYNFYFDAKYCLNKGDDSNYNLLNSLNSNSVEDYIENFETMMAEMDSWLNKHPKAEREFQHRLLINNPQIIDIEYATPKSKTTGVKLNMRLDMLMVEDDKLVIVENKFGTGAITGNAGVRKHYEDICNLLNTSDVYNELVQSVENIAKAKYDLGLIETSIKPVDKTKTEILFLFADFNENSETLNNELKSINITYPISILKMDSVNPLLDLSDVQKV